LIDKHCSTAQIL